METTVSPSQSLSPAARPVLWFVMSLASLPAAGVPALAQTTPKSLPRASAEFKAFRIFQIQAGDVPFASNEIPADFLRRGLQLRFKTNIELMENEIFSLGSSCSLRPDSSGNDSPHFISSALVHRGRVFIKSGEEYSAQRVQTAPGEIRATFSSQSATLPIFELYCRHPQLEAWTVTSFEIHTQNSFEIRTNIQRDPASLNHRYGPEHAVQLSDLKGSSFNGWFGSGLPGHHGIQLLIGARLGAFAQNQNRAIWVGQKCVVLAHHSESSTSVYPKDSKYAYVGKTSYPDQKRIRFEFRNWGYETDSLEVECQGETSEILAWTTQEVESDLNGAIYFYKK